MVLMYLVILDGMGLRDEHSSQNRNALKVSDTPNIDKALTENPNTELKCHGKYVGLPKSRTGSSEVGHLTIGSGQRVEQPYITINRMLDGNIPDEIDQILKSVDSIHFVGLCSDGGIHSDIEHLMKLIEAGNKYGVQNFVHFISDGRDVQSGTAVNYARALKSKGAEISSVVGRYYAMDRDDNTDRTRMALNAFYGNSDIKFDSFEKAVSQQYSKGIDDQHIRPIDIQGVKNLNIGSNVFFFNFRDDRMRQIADLISEGIEGNLHSMIRYINSSEISTIVTRKPVRTTLHDVLSMNGYQDFRISESEKEPHVSWFFDGRRRIDSKNLNKNIVESPEAERYSDTPKMRASSITDLAISIDETSQKFCLVNYANLDLVGHNGDFDATVRAIENVDTQVGRLLKNIKSTVILTSDHGNVEEMGPERNPDRSHTSNPVPMAIANLECSLKEGELSDITPTMLDILGIENECFQGRSLIRDSEF